MHIMDNTAVAETKKSFASRATKISPQQRIGSAMAELRAINVNEPSRLLVAIFAGYTNVNSTGIGRALPTLKAEGMIEYPSSKTMRLTELGVATFPSPMHAPRNNAEAHERILAAVKKVNKSSKKPAPLQKTAIVFRILCDGKSHRSEELMLKAGYKNSSSTGFHTIISTLRKLELTRKPSANSIELTDIAFPFGRGIRPDMPPRCLSGGSNSNARNNPVPGISVSTRFMPEGIASHSNVAHSSSSSKHRLISPENELPTKKKAKPNQARSCSASKHGLASPGSERQTKKKAISSKVSTNAKVNSVRPTKKKATPIEAQTSSKAHRITRHKGSVQDRICTAMVELHAVGISEPPRTYVALFSGYENASRAGFEKALSNAKKDGFVDFPTSSTVRLSGATDSFRTSPPTNNSDMHRRLQYLLKKTKHYPKKVGLLFDALSDGSAYSRRAVADMTNYDDVRSPGFTKFLGEMNGLGIIQYSAEGKVQLADVAFPYGRPQDAETLVL